MRDPAPRPESEDRVWSVGALTREIKALLEEEFDVVRVRGEISGFKIHPSSGHAYFSLKDPQAVLACVAWSSSARRFAPELLARLVRQPEGIRVRVRGRLGVYEPRGQYQLYVDQMAEEGAGDLHAAFLRLKDSLQREGLFDPARKRPLPRVPRRIGIATSPSGAALRDLLGILRVRWPAVEVILRPCAVQGAGAAEEIAAALADLNAVPGVEVIIVARGGGSLEDLWAFNEEITARAIAGSRLPVISAVGHETDFTIADFAADQRAATPSHAAQLAVPDRSEMIPTLSREARLLRAAVTRRLESMHLAVERFRDSRGMRQPEDRLRRGMLDLDRLTDRLRTLLSRRAEAERDRLARAERRLWQQEPRAWIASRRARVEEFRARLDRRCENRLSRLRGRRELAAARLEALGPGQVLARGYSIVTAEADGRLVRSAAEAPRGTALRVRLHRANLRCRVEESHVQGGSEHEGEGQTA